MYTSGDVIGGIDLSIVYLSFALSAFLKSIRASHKKIENLLSWIIYCQKNPNLTHECEILVLNHMILGKDFSATERKNQKDFI